MADRNPRWDEYYPIFDAALDLPADERDAYLNRACGTDVNLRAEVDRLLAADAGSTGLLDSGPSTWSRFLDDRTNVANTLAGQRVGAFRLVTEIGRGGMGVVYLGERVDGDFEQRVAMKLVSALAPSDEALVRFKLERQILARLEHPGIARVVDGGLSDQGIPYLAMEFVDGVTIREYCDANRLSIRRRIELFIRACHAVQYAHENLVVHRDLKPGNILVTESGEPKLLDFGIAKILESDSPSASATTMTALTPGYAAPEQVRGEVPTAATDVYALGMILYGLLTGARPYGPISNAFEAQLAVLTKEPESPSAAVRAIDDQELLHRSDRRDRLASRLAGDLDAIVLKALRKESDARYATVAGLVADLEAHLENRPVAARQGTRSYRARKYLRRHRGPVAAGLAVFVSLVAGLAVSIMQTRAASEAKERALTAQRETAAINEFLIDELLGAADPEESLGRELTVHDILDDASRAIDGAFPGSPGIEASVRRTLAETYASLAEYAPAREHATRAFELYTGAGNERDARGTRRLLATLAIDEGEYEAAIDRLTRLLEETRRRDGEDAVTALGLEVDLGRALNAIGEYDSSAALLERTVSRVRSRHPGDWKLDVRAGKTWVDALEGQGLWVESESVSREVLRVETERLGEHHPDVLRTKSGLASNLIELARYSEAIPLCREIVGGIRRVYGSDHPKLATALTTLALAHARASRYGESVPAMEEALDIFRTSLGEDHPNTINAMMNVAIGNARLGKDERAVGFFREAYETSRRVQGATHPKTLRFQGTLIGRLMAQGLEDEARVLALDLFTVYEGMVADSVVDADHLANYAEDLLGTGPPDVWNPKRALEIAQRGSRLTNRARYGLILSEAGAAKELGDIDHAVACAKEALALPEGIRSFSTERLLAETLIEAGRHDELETSLLELLERRRRTRVESDWLIGNTLTWLGELYLEAGRLDDAEVRLREAVEQLSLAHEPEDFRISRSRSLLGAVLVRQSRFSEAETEATEAFENYLDDRLVSDRVLEKARGVIVDLYETWGKPELASAWRDRPLREEP